MFDSITQAVVGHFVEIGIGTIVTLVMLAIRRVKPEWASAALYGLAIFTMAIFVMTLFRLPTMLPARPAELTPNNIEPQLRQWGSRFGYAVQTVNTDSDNFALRFRFADGRSAAVTNPKQAPQYVMFSMAVSLDEAQQALFNNLSNSEREILLEEVRLDLSRAGRDSFIAPRPGIIGVQKRLPIRDLSESVFIDTMDSTAIGWTLARDSVVLAVRRRANATP